MKKYITIISLSVFCMAIFAMIFWFQTSVQAQPHTETLNSLPTNYWSLVYNLGSDGTATEIITTSDGKFLAVGRKGSLTGPSDVWVAKIDLKGGLEWQKTFSQGNYDSANAVQELANGDYVIAGTLATGNNKEAWLARLDQNGEIVWQFSYDNGNTAEIYALDSTSDGGFLVAGGGEVTSSNFVMKISSDGTPLWQKNYGTSHIYAVWETTTGEIILVGSMFNPNKGVVMKLSANGNIVWQKNMTSTLGVISIRGGTETSDGGIMVTGDFGSGDLLVAKLTAQGEVVWAKVLEDADDEMGLDVSETLDGGVIVAGFKQFMVNSQRGWIVKLGSMGELEWQKVYTGGSQTATISSITQTIDGRLVFAGNADSSVTPQVIWIAYLDAEGSIDDCTGIEETGAGISDLALNLTEMQIVEQDISLTSTIETLTIADATATISVICSVAVKDTTEEFWMRHYSGSYSSQYIDNLQATNDGGLVFIMNSYTSNLLFTEVLITKLDAAGNTTWTRQFNGSGEDFASHIFQTSDGGYLALLNTESFGDAPFWIIKLDSAGNTLWQKTYETALGVSTVETPNGDLLIAGSSMPATGSPDFWAIKLTADGNTLWEKTYGGGATDYLYDMTRLASGEIILAGFTQSFGAGSRDAWILKLDADGNLIWQKTYGGSGIDDARSIQLTSDGGLVFAGSTTSFGPSNNNAWVVKLDSDGNISWQEVLGGPGIDRAYDVILSNDGGLLVGGFTTINLAIPFPDGWIFKLNAEGTPVWEKIYGDTRSDEFYDIDLSADNEIIAGGYSNSPAILLQNTAWLVKTNESGEICDCFSVHEYTSTLTTSTALIQDTSVSAQNYSGTLTDISYASQSFDLLRNSTCWVIPKWTLPTPTPTNTAPTATPSITPTITQTPTITPNSTQTPTSSSTQTPAPSMTSSSTPTPTITPTPTTTPTKTPAMTLTPTNPPPKKNQFIFLPIIIQP